MFRFSLWSMQYATHIYMTMDPTVNLFKPKMAYLATKKIPLHCILHTMSWYINCEKTEKIQFLFEKFDGKPIDVEN